MTEQGGLMIFFNPTDLKSEIVIISIFIGELRDWVMSEVAFLMLEDRVLLHLKWQQSVGIFLLGHENFWFLWLSNLHAVVHLTGLDRVKIGNVDLRLIFSHGTASTSLLS